MKAKFKVGDLVAVNEDYRRQGTAYFGKDLKHKYFRGQIVKVHENTNDERDGQGDIWRNFYGFANGLQICEIFLRRVSQAP